MQRNNGKILLIYILIAPHNKIYREISSVQLIFTAYLWQGDSRLIELIL